MVNIDSLEDFSLLLLAQMAIVDGSIHPVEKEAIIARIKEIFPQITATEERLEATAEQVKKLGKDVCEVLIEDNLDKLNTLSKEQKELLYILLFDVLNADGRVNEEETRTLRQLKTFFLS